MTTCQPSTSQTRGGLDPEISRVASPVSPGSLENLYEKIRTLKEEFQSVEQRMRSAVEALPSEKSPGEDLGPEQRPRSAVETMIPEQKIQGQEEDLTKEQQRQSTVETPEQRMQSVRESLSPPISSLALPHCYPTQPRCSSYIQETTNSSLPRGATSSSLPRGATSSSLPRGATSSSLPRGATSSRLWEETYVQLPVTVHGSRDRMEVGRLYKHLSQLVAYFDDSMKIPAIPVTTKCQNKLQQRTQTIMEMCNKGVDTQKCNFNKQKI